jgi:hypothetical protein
VRTTGVNRGQIESKLTSPWRSGVFVKYTIACNTQETIDELLHWHNKQHQASDLARILGHRRVSDGQRTHIPALHETNRQPALVLSRLLGSSYAATACTAGGEPSAAAVDAAIAAVVLQPRKSSGGQKTEENRRSYRFRHFNVSGEDSLDLAVNQVRTDPDLERLSTNRPLAMQAVVSLQGARPCTGWSSAWK